MCIISQEEASAQQRVAKWEGRPAVVKFEWAPSYSNSTILSDWPFADSSVRGSDYKINEKSCKKRTITSGTVILSLTWNLIPLDQIHCSKLLSHLVLMRYLVEITMPEMYVISTMWEIEPLEFYWQKCILSSSYISLFSPSLVWQTPIFSRGGGNCSRDRVRRYLARSATISGTNHDYCYLCLCKNWTLSGLCSFKGCQIWKCHVVGEFRPTVFGSRWRFVIVSLMPLESNWSAKSICEACSDVLEIALIPVLFSFGNFMVNW